MFKKWIAVIFKSLKESFVHTPRSLGLAWKASPINAIAITILTLLSAILPLGVAYIGKIIIDQVVAQNVQGTLEWVVIELVLIVFQALVLRALFLLRSLLGAKLGHDVNVMILEKALTLELRHFEDPEFYDMLTKARREASSRPVSMVTDSLQLIQNTLTLLGYIGLLLAFSHWAVFGLLLAALPATISEMRFSNVAFRMRSWRSPDTRRLNYVEYVLANDEHAKEVKAFDLGPMLMGRYKELGDRFYNEDKKLSIERSVWAYLLSLLATAAFYVCYGVMAIAAAAGRLTLGNLTLYVVAFRQGQQAFQSCLTAIGSMYESNLYMSNLFEYLDIQVESKKAGANSQLPVTSTQTGIQFENVSFRYPGKTTDALSNINLRIPAGQSLALVGHNGAGKTTFIKLLCRLYDPTSGRILLDGKDLRDWNELDLRKRISTVFQDFNQYHFKLSENVGVGQVTHLEDIPRIERAVDRGGASDVVKDFAKGLETPLGRWFHEGVELSGGQWQKVALARAFMREEADILILDEPTAALDAEAEQKVFERFRQLTQGKTALLISHRFPTVRMADHIIVIDGGKIIEEGTHDSLVKSAGRYAQLFSLQAKGYL